MQEQTFKHVPYVGRNIDLLYILCQMTAILGYTCAICQQVKCPHSYTCAKCQLF